MERAYYTLSLGPWDALALWGQWSYLGILFVWEFCDDVSVLWGQYLHHRHRDLWTIHLIFWCAFYRSLEDFGYLYEDDIVLRRLWSTLWISYYSGRKTSAIQLYLADLHWQCRTEHSILHWGWKLWDAISMWKLIWRKNFVFWLCLVSRRRLYRYLVWITSFLRS